MNAEVSMLEVFSHTALKGVVVLAVALIFGLLLHRLAAARRYAVWITAVGALALLPPAMLLLPAWRVLPQANKTVMEWPEPSPEEIIESHEPIYLPVRSKMTFPASAFEAPPASPAAVAPPPSPKLSWQEIAALLPHLWLSISSLLLLRLACGAGRLRRLERTLEPGTCELLAKVAQEMKLKRIPRLLIGGENAVPMVWGVWRQRLLLPRGFETWSREKLRGVLLHELAHLKRRDPLALWTAQWVKAFHWFNPLAWLTIRQLRADQERACDDTVLRHGVRPSDYAQHLLDLSRHTRLAPGLSLCTLTITRCAPVEARVKAILDPKRSREGLTARWLLSLAGLALLTTLPVAMLHAIEGPKMRGRMLDRNGVVLAETTEKKRRHYPLQALTGHVTGYTRLPDEKHPQSWGGAAMEKMHDATLQEGKDVALSLDARVQSLVMRTMREAGYQRGAVVVLDPRTGEILASVSLPVYDPNILVPAISQKDWDALLKNQDMPLLNRCVRGFVPGAAFTPFTALAGATAGVGGRSFTCNGSVTYGSSAFVCWRQRQNGAGHGTLDMKGALVASCSCYWYQFGNATGTEAFDKIGDRLGFGQGYALVEDEHKGVLSTPTWMARIRPQEKWTSGHTANMAIGQGSMLATPLQMAVLAATVAQRGKVPQPTFLQLKKGEHATPRADLVAEGADAGQIDQIREGMRLAVNGPDGTGKSARSDKVVVSGKTGIAQNWRRVGGMKVVDNHGWFIGFAPHDNPTLAFAIFRSGARSGGADCAPLAKRIVEETLALPVDGSGAVAPVAAPPPDTAGAEIKDEVGREAAAMGESFKLDVLRIQDGKIVVTGGALSAAQALGFLDRLRALGGRRGIQLEIPPPTIQDDNTAIFRAVGAYRPQPVPQGTPDSGKEKNQTPGASTGADTTKAEVSRLIQQLKKNYEKIQQLEEQLRTGATDELEQQREECLREKRDLLQAVEKALRKAESKIIPASDMWFDEKERWQALRKAEGLAEMPTEAKTFVTGAENRALLTPFSDFRFSATRAAVHHWLLESLSKRALENYKNELQWPENDVVFQRVYYTSKGGLIQVRSQGAAEVEVSLWKARPPIGPDGASTMMGRVEAENWKGLQVQGRLAPLPAGVTVHKIPKRDDRWLQFEFSAPREAAHRWLLDSLSEQMRTRQAAALQWPEAPEAFQRSYTAADLCDITVQYGDVDLVYLIISKQKPRMMIAPDEATPPRPKTAAPQELEGVVNVNGKMSNPS